MEGNLPVFTLSSFFLGFREERNQLSCQIQLFPLDSSCFNVAVGKR